MVQQDTINVIIVVKNLVQLVDHRDYDYWVAVLVVIQEM